MINKDLKNGYKHSRLNVIMQYIYTYVKVQENILKAGRHNPWLIENSTSFWVKYLKSYVEKATKCIRI